MPRPKNLIPTYRRHGASGQAVVQIAGHTHYLGPHGSKTSKEEYDRLIAEYLASGRSPTFGQPADGLTVVVLVAEYLRYAKAYYGPGPRGEYANMKRAVASLKKLYGRTLAAEFGPQQLKAVREAMIDDGGSRTYVNSSVRRVIRVFRWAAGEGRVPAAVPQALAMVPGLRKGRTTARENAAVKPVERTLVDATLPHLSSVVRAMVELQLLTGARPGEICALRAGDVDRRDAVWEARLEDHKTAHHGRTRTIYIGPKAQEVLAPYLLRGAEEFCFSPRAAVEERRERDHANRQVPLSCGNRPGTNRQKNPKRQAGDRYATGAYARAIQRACEIDELEHWTPNQLRHLAATEIRRQFDLDAAKTILGHSQVGTTEIYAEKDRMRAIEVARKIG